MSRSDGRSSNQLREIKVTPDYINTATGSCMIEFGNTRVVCTAMTEDRVPMFLKNSGTGWVTAEYGMLPGSCDQRVRRDRNSGRVYEIQRLIGRSLRGVVELDKLGERTIKIDCDVIQADGGTRTASITGAFIALAKALLDMQAEGIINTLPITDYVAAVSVGVKSGEILLDLDFEEDSSADMDMNVVMLGSGKFMELQGTAEGAPFSKDQADQLIDLAKDGIEKLFEIQKSHLNNLAFSST